MGGARNNAETAKSRSRREETPGTRQDDAPRAAVLRAVRREDADGARAEDRDGVAPLDLAHVARVPRRRQDVGQQQRAVVVEGVGHLEAVGVGCCGRLGGWVLCVVKGAGRERQRGRRAVSVRQAKLPASNLIMHPPPPFVLLPRLTGGHAHVLRLAALPAAREVRVAEEAAGRLRCVVLCCVCVADRAWCGIVAVVGVGARGIFRARVEASQTISAPPLPRPVCLLSPPHLAVHRLLNAAGVAVRVGGGWGEEASRSAHSDSAPAAALLGSAAASKQEAEQISRSSAPQQRAKPAQNTPRRARAEEPMLAEEAAAAAAADAEGDDDAVALLQLAHVGADLLCVDVDVDGVLLKDGCVVLGVFAAAVVSSRRQARLERGESYARGRQTPPLPARTAAADTHTHAARSHTAAGSPNAPLHTTQRTSSTTPMNSWPSTSPALRPGIACA